MYRIYKLEEVIHENLRPEKSQEVQKVGGKRKSYNLDPDNSEALEDDNTRSKKPRRKKAKKGITEAVGPEVVVAGADADAKTGKRRPSHKRRKAS